MAEVKRGNTRQSDSLQAGDARRSRLTGALTLAAYVMDTITASVWSRKHRYVNSE
jgi:hypothetical protein